MWSWFLVHMCKMMTSLDVFFYFFKSLIFWVVWGGKRQNMTQNDKKNLSLTLYLKNHTSYDWFLIHMCKITISPAIFLFFQNSDCLGLCPLFSIKFLFFTKWYPFKNLEICFLFHLKNSFHSRDIQIFAFLSSPLFFPCQPLL